ncbi:hypothetical protein Pen02_18760 [Plantactinospora endophytica]|uniref:Peptidase C14 caspase domain-containing protein n=1 Tax=Plantactinospora endophytica TaxID=673535 RepID=A0ABQ4DWU8_9ACTN|nr:hypothetical protein Pen02_18760 [Plantactinospora endophytica]
MTKGLPPLSALPNPAGSRAVLVGVSEYLHDSMDPLPAVKRNVETLGELLVDPDLWGLKSEHCVRLLNPRSNSDVLDAVHAAATEATDALVVYFAGHGLLDDRSDLYLALPDADRSRIFRGVRYDDVRREVVGARRCNGKIVILDCCYSGRALQGGMSGSVEAVNHASIDGTYLMTASAETSVALAPIGEEYTAFTGALLDYLVNGISGGPELLDMETLFFHVRARMLERNFPIPQQRSRNAGNILAIARNRRVSAGAITRLSIQRALPNFPAGLERLRRPRDISTTVERLLRDERSDEACALLAATGARLSDQNVAAVLEALNEDRHSVVIAGAALRPPAEVHAIISALRETAQPEQASQLLMAVADRPAGEVAELAYQLRMVDADDDIVTLLDATLAGAQGQRELIGLVHELWLIGMRRDVDQLLERAAGRLSGSDVLVLADELRNAGRTQAAYALYKIAVNALTGRPPAGIAQLVAEIATEDPETSTLIASTVIRACSDSSAFLELANAFRSTAQQAHADATLHHAALHLDPTDIIDAADTLLEGGDEKAALQLCAEAVKLHPARAREFATALHEGGRPVDARRLLQTAIAEMPSSSVAQLLPTFDDPLELHRATAVVAGRTSDDLAHIAAELLNHDGPTAVAQFISVLRKHVEDIKPILHSAVQIDDPEMASTLTKTLLPLVPPTEAAALLSAMSASDVHALLLYAAQIGQPYLGELVDAVRGGARSGAKPNPARTGYNPKRHSRLAPRPVGNRFDRGVKSDDHLLAMLSGFPVDRLHLLLPEIRRAGLEDYAWYVAYRADEGKLNFRNMLNDNDLGHDGALGAHEIALLTLQLLRAGDDIDATTLLQYGMRRRSMAEQRDIVIELDRRGTSSEVLAMLALLRRSLPEGLPGLGDALRREGLPQYADALAPPVLPPVPPPRKRFWSRG